MKLKFEDAAPYLNRCRAHYCVNCQTPFDFARDHVEGYEHSGGHLINGGRLWLYVTCRKCGYQTSLVKLGLPRNHDPANAVWCDYCNYPIVEREELHRRCVPTSNRNYHDKCFTIMNPGLLCPLTGG